MYRDFQARRGCLARRDGASRIRNRDAANCGSRGQTRDRRKDHCRVQTRGRPRTALRSSRRTRSRDCRPLPGDDGDSTQVDSLLNEARAATGKAGQLGVAVAAPRVFDVSHAIALELAEVAGVPIAPLQSGPNEHPTIAIAMSALQALAHHTAVPVNPLRLQETMTQQASTGWGG